MKKKLLFIILPIVLISGILLGGTYFVNNRYVNTDTFYQGISVGGIDLDGLTLEEAIVLVEKEKEEEISGKGIDLIYEDYVQRLSLTEIGY